MTHYNFTSVWKSTRSERPKFAIKFLESLSNNVIVKKDRIRSFIKELFNWTNKIVLRWANGIVNSLFHCRSVHHQGHLLPHHHLVHPAPLALFLGGLRIRIKLWFGRDNFLLEVEVETDKRIEQDQKKDIQKSDHFISVLLSNWSFLVERGYKESS